MSRVLDFVRDPSPIRRRRALELARRRALQAVSSVKGSIGSLCRVCGDTTLRYQRQVLWDSLIDAWALTPAEHVAIERREGSQCVSCDASLRSHHLATALLEHLQQFTSSPISSMADLGLEPVVADLASLRVAELNSCGELHPYLAKLAGLRYSEYLSEDPAVPHEDVQALSYDDDSFDLVLSSDTLEHVPDFVGALAEVERVLRPGGTHIFTVPVLWNRPTSLRRAALENGEIVHLHPPSFHGVPLRGAVPDSLVFMEFGADIADLIATGAIDYEIVRDPEDSTLTVFVGQMPVEP